MRDYLAIEALLIDHLEERLGRLVRHVSGAQDYATVEESRIPTPAVYVVYQGDVILGDGRVQRIEQQWGVVVAVRHVGSDQRLRQQAGPILAAVLDAVMGHTPEGAQRPFYRVQGPPPSYSERIGYFPLLFQIPVVMEGQT